MLQTLAKDAVLWGISKGFRLPQVPIDRVNELAFLKGLISHLDIDCVLDVGANRGQFAKELRRIGYAGLIISFEPISTEYRVLCDAFKDDSEWKGYQFALGSIEESKSIRIPHLTVLSSILESVVDEKNYRTETIEVKRLDRILSLILNGRKVSRIFLKMDTQGYDLEVFKGAAHCLGLIFGIQSELSVQPLYKNMPHYIEALETYEAAGFELYNLSVVSRTGGGGLIEMNCFMRRPQ